MLGTFDNPYIKQIENTQQLLLGDLRNLGIQKANGEYVIQWDDDDEYHPQRMEYQFKVVAYEGYNKACCLSRWLIYDNLTDKKYISSYCTWEGSILSPKIFLLQHPYPSLSRGEDTIVIKQLQKENKIKLLNMPELYTYHLHWKNTYDRNHGLKMIKKSIEIPKKSWKSLRQELILVDENNLPLNLEWEREEQEDIIKYLDSGSSVLELGGRYGVVSCVTNNLLNNVKTIFLEKDSPHPRGNSSTQIRSTKWTSPRSPVMFRRPLKKL